MKTNITSRPIVWCNVTQTKISTACYVARMSIMHGPMPFPLRLLLFFILLAIVLLNIAVIYATLKQKMMFKNIFHRIMLSIFTANIVYAFGSCIVYVHAQLSCEYVITSHFLKVFGAIAEILCVMALSLLQFQQLKVSDVNNKLLQGQLKKNMNRAMYHLIYIWTLSLISSIVPVVVGIKQLFLLPTILGLLAIATSLLHTYWTSKIISKHRKRLLTRNVGNSYVTTLIRSERVLQGSFFLVVIAWIPSMIGQCVIRNFTLNDKHTQFVLVTANFSILYPVLQPIVYISKTKEISKFLIRKFVRCQSQKESRVEDFYDKLKVQRRFYRSKIQPFIIENNMGKEAEE